MCLAFTLFHTLCIFPAGNGLEVLRLLMQIYGPRTAVTQRAHMKAIIAIPSASSNLPDVEVGVVRSNGLGKMGSGKNGENADPLKGGKSSKDGKAAGKASQVGKNSRSKGSRNFVGPVRKEP